MSDQGSDARSRVGGGIGSAIGSLVVNAATQAKQKAAPVQQRMAEGVFTRVTNHISDEVRSVMGPLFREAAEHPDTPEEARPLLRALGNRKGQAWAWIGGTATGAALGGGLMNLLSNAMNPVVLPIIAARPAGVLNPSDAAQGEARDIAYSRSWEREAAYSGIDSERFRALVAMNRQAPTAEQLMALVNRGRINEATAQTLLRGQGQRQEFVDDIVSLRHSDLSPEVLAAMWNRDIVTSAEGRALAQRSGVSSKDFDRLTALGGEPPAVQELLLAWRRGEIDEGDVNRALIQGPLRKEWIPVIKQLRWEPLSPNEAADGVNQGHIDQAEAQREAGYSGVRPEHFRLMIENAGLPPGLEFASEAYNRGYLSEDEWTKMFLESRIKNRYLPVMRQMRTRIIAPETVRLMWREGVYSDAEAVKALMGNGFSKRDAEAQLDLERQRRTQGTKDLTRAQLVDLYEEDLIERGQLESALADQGYDATEVGWIADIAEVNKVRRFVTSATNAIKRAYTSGRIDEAEATGQLTNLGYGPVSITRMVSIWDVERDTTSSQLTVAQILSAAKKEIISWDEAYRRLVDERGFTPDDASILSELNGGPRFVQQGGTQ